MQQKKTKIILDADVIIHFVKAEAFFLCCRTSFPNTNMLFLVSPSTGASLKDYFQLLKTFGHGESACMIYCREHRDVLGNSNLKDIKDYCLQNGITFLTTLDFLYYAFLPEEAFSAEECNEFIAKVIASGSKLPEVDITRYKCTVAI